MGTHLAAAQKTQQPRPRQPRKSEKPERMGFSTRLRQMCVAESACLVGATALPHHPGTKEKSQVPSPIPHPQPPPCGSGRCSTIRASGARYWSKVGPPPAALNETQPGRPPTQAQSAGGELWTGFLRWCLPNVQAHIRRHGAFHVTAPPETILSRAAWRRRHHRTPRAPEGKGLSGLRLPSALPLVDLTCARSTLGMPGSALSTPPRSPSELPLPRGLGWGRRIKGLRCNRRARAACQPLIA